MDEIAPIDTNEAEIIALCEAMDALWLEVRQALPRWLRWVLGLRRHL